MRQAPNRALKVLLVDYDQEAARATREKLSNAQFVVFQVSIADSLLAALTALARAPFDVALVDTQLPDAQGLEVLGTIQRHAPGMPVVLEAAHDLDLLAPRAVEMGAHDYLLKSHVTAEALERVLTYAMARNRAGSQPQAVETVKAPITGVIGSKGGVGTTTLACHHAVSLAALTKQRILLIDLDLSGSSAAFLLEATSEYSVTDASLNLHRLDAALWDSLVSHNDHSVDLLCSPGARSFHAELDGERVRHVLRFARTRYDRIIVDLGRLTTLSLALLEEMNEVYLVTTVDLPALFEVGRVLRKLMDLGMRQEQVRLILNRVGKSVDVIGPKETERALGYPVYCAVGDHNPGLAECLSQGHRLPLESQLHAQVTQFTEKVLGMTPTPRPGGLRGLLRFARA